MAGKAPAHDQLGEHIDYSHSPPVHTFQGPTSPAILDVQQHAKNDMQKPGLEELIAALNNNRNSTGSGDMF